MSLVLVAAEKRKADEKTEKAREKIGLAAGSFFVLRNVESHSRGCSVERVSPSCELIAQIKRESVSTRDEKSHRCRRRKKKKKKTIRRLDDAFSSFFLLLPPPPTQPKRTLVPAPGGCLSAWRQSPQTPPRGSAWEWDVKRKRQASFGKRKRKRREGRREFSGIENGGPLKEKK